MATAAGLRGSITPGPKALRNKSYPVAEILDVLSEYNKRLFPRTC